MTEANSASNEDAQAPPQPTTSLIAKPWETAVDGSELLDELKGVFEKYLFLPMGASVTLALWTVHTYAVDAAHIFPIISALSPQKRCGKTTLLRVLKGLVRQPVLASHFTMSSMYRLIEGFRPTLLIDEADTYLKNNHALINVLNSGHTRDGQVVVSVRIDPGSEWTTQAFSTWSAKSIAAIGDLPETIEDRSIIIPLHRRPKTVTLGKYGAGQDEHSEILRRKIVRWVVDHIGQLKANKPQAVEPLDDRAADNWSPLLSIAEVAGEKWAQLGREAALLLSANTDDRLSISEMLLADFRMILEGTPGLRIKTQDLLNALENIGDRPWADFHGRERSLTAFDLSKVLRNYGIRPVKIRFGDRSYQGYNYDSHIQEICERYAPQVPEHPEHAEQAMPEASNVPDVPHVPSPKSIRINLRTGEIYP